MIRLALLVAVALLAAAPAALATFPGRNGGFATTAAGCQENQYIRLLDASARRVRDLTPRCAELGEDDYRDTYAPEWSPDGTRLAYVEDSLNTTPTVMTMLLDGSDARPVAPGGPSAGKQPVSFSPAGDRIAFERDGKLYTAAVDGGDERTLHDGTPFYTRPRWSPDGTKFVVERRGPPGGLWLIEAATGRTLRRVARGGFEADWSPDGRRIVFRTSYHQREIRGGASGGNLYVARADGRGKPRRIVHRERVAETSPVWSPDGRYIAWVSLRFTAGDVGFRIFPSVWRVPARGGRPRMLSTLPQPFVEEGFYDAPVVAWQPLP